MTRGAGSAFAWACPMQPSLPVAAHCLNPPVPSAQAHASTAGTTSRLRTVDQAAAGAGHHRPAGRRGHRAVHCPLPQGSHRQPGRHAAAPPVRTPDLSARAGRPPPGHPGLDHRTGQAHARAGRTHRRGRQQAATGGSVRPLQAQASHQGADCPRSRTGTAGRCPAGQPHAGARDRGSRLSETRLHHARWRQSGRGRCQGSPGRCAADPDGALCRRCRPGGPPARVPAGKGGAHFQGGRRQIGKRRQVCRLFRLPGTAFRDSLAPGTGTAARTPRRSADADAETARRGGWCGRPGLVRAHHCRPGGHCRPEAPGRSVAAADGALDLADQAGLADRERTDQHPAREGRGRSHPRLRSEREGSAAGGTGRTAGHDGAGPWRAYRREGGGGGRHRQASGDGHHLPTPAAQRLDWFAGHAGPTVRNPQGGAGGHRQRHRLARDRQAGGRPDARPATAAPDQGCGLRSRRLGVFGLGAGSAGIPGAGREPAGCGLHRPSPAGPAGRAGQDRAQGHRCGPVPARREPDPPGQGAGRRGGGLRQRRGRGPEHGQRAAAHPHCGSGTVASREHRPSP